MTEKNSTPEVLTSPEMKVIFSVLRSPRKSSFKDGEAEYSMRGEVDGSNVSAEDFKKALKKINKSLIITEDKEGNTIVEKDGNYIINARTRNKPTVFDKNNKVIPSEEVPMLESGSTVRLLLTTFQGKSGKGGGLNLAGVQLLDVIEYEGSEPVDQDTLEKALKAAHGK